MTDDPADGIVRKAQAVSNSIKPLLAGQGPDVQGVVLVELVAMHIAGHCILDDVAATRKLREELLAAHIEAVRNLIPEIAREIGAVVTHDDIQ